MEADTTTPGMAYEPFDVYNCCYPSAYSSGFLSVCIITDWKDMSRGMLLAVGTGNFFVYHIPTTAYEFFSRTIAGGAGKEGKNLEGVA